MKKYFTLWFILISFVSVNGQYTWVNKNQFPSTAFFSGGSFVINGKAYISGGFINLSPLTVTNATWQYNPNNDTWMQKANYPHTAAGGAYFSFNGKGYLIGGGDSTGHYYSDNYSYDPVADTWVPKTSFPENGVGAGGYFFIINGIAYVGAGARNNSVHGSVSGYSYNPTSDAWSSIANYPGNPSIGLCTFAIDSFGYAGMGGDGSGHFYTDMHKYNPATNTWSTIAPFPGKARYVDGSSFVVNGKAYVGAGQTPLNGGSSYCLGDYYMYDPVTDTWSLAPGIPGPPRTYPIAFSFDDSAYIVGGYNQDGGVYYKFVDEFKPASGTCSAFDTVHVTAYDTTHLSVTDTLFITVNVGLASNNTTNILEVYPNPAHNQLYINTGDYAAMSGYLLKIINPLGQIAFVNAFNQSVFTINISSWSTGVYFLQILDASNAVVETKEIVIH